MLHLRTRCALEVCAVAVLQVLADRGETGSRHGRAAFSILLFQVRVNETLRITLSCHSC
jgi:hypothetical protein